MYTAALSLRSYDERSDGPWPSEPEGPAGTLPGKTWQVVAPPRLEAVRRAAAGASTIFWASEFLEQGDALRVGMSPRDANLALDPVACIAGDALALLAPLFASSDTWTRVETEWRTWWRDVDGILRLKPTWSMSLDRATFEGQGWTSLSPSQQRELLVWRPWHHAGWTQVHPGVPAPEPIPPPAPGVPAPSPEVPDPTSPLPPETLPPETLPPNPAPPAVPPRPAPPPPTEPPKPPTGPLPTLTSSARKAAEAGLARMRELLTLAQTAHDEGVQAHRSGSNDLWQEKINEASAHIGELEDVWTSQVLEAMPGSDEGVREELAIEHFGAIWDDVYALKSILRKTRAMR